MSSARTFHSEPLTPEAFAPFGAVVMAERGDVPSKPANQGTARRYDWLAEVANRRPDAKLNLCVFRCAPREHWPMSIALLEKHAQSAQVFVPMNAARYVVLVAAPSASGDGPDLSTLRSFLATGRQGIAYAPGTWHHPLLALDEETDFACVVWEDETESDCSVAHFPEAERPVVHL